MTGIPFFLYTSAHNSFESDAAPDANERIDETSYFSAKGDVAIAMSMGGTTNMNVTRYFWTASKKCSTLKREKITQGVEVCSEATAISRP